MLRRTIFSYANIQFPFRDASAEGSSSGRIAMRKLHALIARKKITVVDFETDVRDFIIILC